MTQQTILVPFKKLTPTATTPRYSSDEAAGADMYADLGGPDEYVVIPAGSRALVRTGIAIELPAGYEAQVRARSGLALKDGITVLNSPGTIDSDYRGDCGVILHNTSDKSFMVNHGDRIAQMVIAPVVRARFAAAGGNLRTTARGDGGYGSTGV